MDLPHFSTVLSYASERAALAPYLFYLVEPQARLADWQVQVFIKESVHVSLPVHSQTLGLASPTLLDIAASKAGQNRHPVWDCSVVHALALLRLIYRPQEVTVQNAQLLVEAGLIDGVIRLAHKLNVYILNALVEACISIPDVSYRSIERLGALGMELHLTGLKDARAKRAVQRITSLGLLTEDQARNVVLSLGTSTETLQAALMTSLMCRKFSNKRVRDHGDPTSILGALTQDQTPDALFTGIIPNFQGIVLSGNLGRRLNLVSASFSIEGSSFAVELTNRWDSNPPALNEAYLGLCVKMYSPPEKSASRKFSYTLRILNAWNRSTFIEKSGTKEFCVGSSSWGWLNFIPLKTALAYADGGGNLIVQVVGLVEEKGLPFANGPQEQQK